MASRSLQRLQRRSLPASSGSWWPQGPLAHGCIPPALHSACGAVSPKQGARLLSPCPPQAASRDGCLFLICTHSRRAHGDPGGPSVSRDSTWEASGLSLSLSLLLPCKGFSQPQGKGPWSHPCGLMERILSPLHVGRNPTSIFFLPRHELFTPKPQSKLGHNE